eukprot:3219295-Amphidinium_carterae.1
MVLSLASATRKVMRALHTTKTASEGSRVKHGNSKGVPYVVMQSPGIPEHGVNLDMMSDCGEDWPA